MKLTISSAAPVSSTSDSASFGDDQRGAQAPRARAAARAARLVVQRRCRGGESDATSAGSDAERQPVTSDTSSAAAARGRRCRRSAMPGKPANCAGSSARSDRRPHAASEQAGRAAGDRDRRGSRSASAARARPRDAPTARPDRRALSAARRAREQQRRDVGAGDQQHERRPRPASPAASVRTSPTNASRSGRRFGAWFGVLGRESPATSRAPMIRSSSRACAGDTPSRSRPIASRKCAARSVRS